MTVRDIPKPMTADTWEGMAGVNHFTYAVFLLLFPRSICSMLLSETGYWAKLTLGLACYGSFCLLISVPVP